MASFMFFITSPNDHDLWTWKWVSQVELKKPKKYEWIDMNVKTVKPKEKDGYYFFLNLMCTYFTCVKTLNWVLVTQWYHQYRSS
jgi:hypothetical protein